MKSVHEAVHTVRSLTVKLQSQSVEAELVDQSVCLPSTPDLTEITTYTKKVSTVREVFISNQRLNSNDSIKSLSTSSTTLSNFNRGCLTC